MKIKEAEKNRLDSLIDANCPPGHTVLSETERIDSLEIAKKSNYKSVENDHYNIQINVSTFLFASLLGSQDLINELNRLPMTSKTLRVKNREIEIERELRQLDDTIQIFSRSRVYVKNDQQSPKH